MGREWKPGDVAMVPGVGVAVMSHYGWLSQLRPEPACPVPNYSGARPLVVIDPEDREQVERLTNSYRDSDRTNGHPEWWQDMQVALRSLITGPKPEEPTGLGAVVVDSNDVTYVLAGRLSPDGLFLRDRWRAVDGPVVGDWKKWDQIDVVEVLSEGVKGATR